MSTTARPQVSVFDAQGQAKDTVELPAVFETIVRPDLVHFVHTNMAKNARQAYGVSRDSGYQTSAESWGTGRAVARIPRVAGAGTHRSGQAAFGNMCRGGGMFAPTKTYRRWHRRINVEQKRRAIASALAATASSALVMARGHKVGAVAELPIVVEDEAIESVPKTKDARELLAKLGCGEDLERCLNSRRRRTGTAARRGRVHSVRRGPLIVHKGDLEKLRGFRNIPGTEFADVDTLSLLQMAPGGTLGRLCVYTKSAMEYIKERYPKAPRAVVTNADVARLINSDEIQSVLRPKRSAAPSRFVGPTNGLKNAEVIARLALKKF